MPEFVEGIVRQSSSAEEVRCLADETGIMTMKDRSSSWSNLERAHSLATLILFGFLPCVCGAQSLKSCKTIFIQPMPESLDRFVSAEVVKWGVMKVVTVEERADCLASFGRQASRVQVKSSGSVTVPKEANVSAEDATDKLPVSMMSGASQAALEIVQRESSVVVWAGSKSSRHGPMSLAKQLVDELKKDYQKSK
jgi:hypothetical protein